MTDGLYAGYHAADGSWLAKAPEWEDIKEAPHDRVYRVLDRGEARMARWGVHEFTGVEGWLSVVDPALLLEPTHFRDLVRPPNAA